MPDGFEPKIVAFFCNWCTYLAADLAGTSRIKYAPNAEVVRVMCSGRVDVQFVLKAFAKGADGVLIGGCHPGDGHYQEGNYKALRRYRLLKRLLKQMGIEEERLRLEWISAAEGDRVRVVVLRLLETFALSEVSHAIEDALQLGTISFDAVRHLMLCRIERRPPRLDMQEYPPLPLAQVHTTQAADYMSLLVEVCA